MACFSIGLLRGGKRYNKGGVWQLAGGLQPLTIRNNIQNKDGTSLGDI
jgi:hypothetical protein